MLRKSFRPPLLTEVIRSLGVKTENAAFPLYFIVSQKRSRHSGSRFHSQLTSAKLGNSKHRLSRDSFNSDVRKSLSQPCVLKDDVSNFGKFEVEALRTKGVQRLQRAPVSRENAAQFLKASGRIVNPIETDIVGRHWVLNETKRKFGLLPSVFGISGSVLNAVTRGVHTQKRTSTMTATAEKKPRAKRKLPSTPTVIDEYGYNYDNEDTFSITAYAVCDEFDLKRMHKGLIAQGLYIPTVLSDDLSNVIHVTAKYPIGDEPREIFFFREGAVILWNVPYLETVNVLKFLKEYQDESYEAAEVNEESESMIYTHGDQPSTRLVRGKVFLGNESKNKLLEKYAFANALASSVKLGIWESTLEKYVEGIERMTEALKRGEDIKLSRSEVLQKTGELFALRHELNLNSDLLDTPDFYWDREHLETLYQKTCDYLSIHRRTKVMNEKLSQCCEILDLISSHLTDNHHTRLEWMIIILIMIEVGFEILHLLERYEIVH